MTARIEVAIRVRPLLDHEKRLGLKNSKMLINSETNEIKINLEDQKTAKVFKFDTLLPETTSQEQVFTDVQIDNLLTKVVEGYHSTIFAYGQTGSGKTFTMEGFQYEINSNDKIPRAIIDPNSPDIGVIPRAIVGLFDKIKRFSKNNKKIYTVYCSFLQVYNERIYDLLNPSQLNKIGQNNPGLRIRWNKKEQFVVENLYVYECKTADEVLEHFFNGVRNKTMATHKLNLASSRAHSMLSLRVESVDLADPDNICISKFDLVDLAGSERSALTGNEGQVQQKESIEINKSLFTLRQVITTLADLQRSNANNEQKARVHIPYRESKLTCLLKQSIGGNNYCLMIACLAPVDRYIEENISTLTYATKATYISNEPIKNEDPKTQFINDLKMQVSKLASELTKANDHISFLSQITNEKVEKYGTEFLKKGPQLEFETSPNKFQNSGYSQKEKRPGNDTINDQTNKQSSGAIGNELDGPEQTSMMKRMIESINMVRELLKSNKEIREKFDKLCKKSEDQENEIFQLQIENQDLRDKLQIFENMNNQKESITSETPELDDNEDINQMTKTAIVNEIFNLRKYKKNLENRIKTLEIENHNLIQKFNPIYNQPNYKEPKRSVIEISPQDYSYNNVSAMKTKFMEKFAQNENYPPHSGLDNSLRLTPIQSQNRKTLKSADPINDVEGIIRNNIYTHEFGSPGLSEGGRIDLIRNAVFSMNSAKVKPNSTFQIIKRNPKTVTQFEVDRTDGFERSKRKQQQQGSDANRSLIDKNEGPFIISNNDNQKYGKRSTSMVH